MTDLRKRLPLLLLLFPRRRIHFQLSYIRPLVSKLSQSRPHSLAETSLFLPYLCVRVYAWPFQFFVLKIITFYAPSMQTPIEIVQVYYPIENG
jgi:hypothetical protein